MFNVIHKLNWDSDFFGFNIAHINKLNSPEDRQRLEKFVQSNLIDFVQANPDVSDADYIKTLENHGFHLADIYVTYSLRVLRSRKPTTFMRVAEVNDIPQLKMIAAKSFILTRYDRSPFTPDRVLKFYETWVEKAVTGAFDDGCLVACEDGIIIGFVTHRSVKSTMRIGLIAVGDKYRRRGVGRDLLRAVGVLAKKNAQILEAVTSLRNTDARKMYAGSSFFIEQAVCWYYKSYYLHGR